MRRRTWFPLALLALAGLIVWRVPAADLVALVAALNDPQGAAAEGVARHLERTYRLDPPAAPAGPDTANQ